MVSSCQVVKASRRHSFPALSSETPSCLSEELEEVACMGCSSSMPGSMLSGPFLGLSGRMRFWSDGGVSSMFSALFEMQQFMMPKQSLNKFKEEPFPALSCESVGGPASENPPLFTTAVAAWEANTCKKCRSSAVKLMSYATFVGSSAILASPGDTSGFEKWSMRWPAITLFVALLMSCTTPMTPPFLTLSGTHIIFLVLNPVLTSTSLLKRASL
mmetsp:Transcript_16937/g.39546  ORF Transcript_16937/g.39546 Transcript_16937/m.39546 type:complete len:215 (+) Transcript_16937:1282-1926(+)